MSADPHGDERLALIAAGAKLTLPEAVREFLDAADDQLEPHRRPPQAHGGCFMNRWRFERLRAALKAVERAGQERTDAA